MNRDSFFLFFIVLLLLKVVSSFSEFKFFFNYSTLWISFNLSIPSNLNANINRPIKIKFKLIITQNAAYSCQFSNSNTLKKPSSVKISFTFLLVKIASTSAIRDVESGVLQKQLIYL